MTCVFTTRGYSGTPADFVKLIAGVIPILIELAGGCNSAYSAPRG